MKLQLPQQGATLALAPLEKNNREILPHTHGLTDRSSLGSTRNKHVLKYRLAASLWQFVTNFAAREK